MRKRGLHPDRPLKVAAIGGGTGLAALLRALKPEAERARDPWKLTGIVTVSDNGGSSGRLRAELGGIPPGDLRNCLSALTQKESVLSDLLNYRFKGEGALAGHSLGNLMLMALADITGDWVRAIRQLSGILVTVGRLYPSTLVPVTLMAEDMQGNRHVGEIAVSTCKPPMARLWLEPREVEPLPESLLAVIQSDLIFLAPGSLFTSTLPNLLIEELSVAIHRSRRPVIYVANLMTERGESAGLDLEAHIASIQSFGGIAIHAVIANDTVPSPEVLHRYQEVGGSPLFADRPVIAGVPIRNYPLLDPEALTARHHPAMLNQAIRDAIQSL